MQKTSQHICLITVLSLHQRVDDIDVIHEWCCTWLPNTISRSYNVNSRAKPIHTWQTSPHIICFIMWPTT